MLRKPLHHPPSSEGDAYDGMAHHQMVVDEQGKPVAMAVERLYVNVDNEARYAFWRCIPRCRIRGLGTLLAITLEFVARQEEGKPVVYSAREDAVDFFDELEFVNQGEIITPSITLIRHYSNNKAHRHPG